MTENKEYLTTEQVSKMLGMHRNTVTNLKSKLKPVKALNGRDNLYDPDVVQAFIEDKIKKNNLIKLVTTPGMRTFHVHYNREYFDSSDDFVEEVKCPNIEFVIPTFREKVRVCKRIFKIEEVTKPNYGNEN